MTAYNATPTADLYDLLRAKRRLGDEFALTPWFHKMPVTVAMWEPHDPAIPAALRSPATAVASMSAALYVRLFPNGHCGPTVSGGVGDLWGPTVLDGGKS